MTTNPAKNVWSGALVLALLLTAWTHSASFVQQPGYTPQGRGDFILKLLAASGI